MKSIKNTYIYPKKEDIEIEVGDVKQADFKPRMKIKRWDNEVNFSVGVISDHKGINVDKDDTVEWNDGHGVKARFYELPPDEQNEYGIFEFELILDEKPVSNIIEMSIETKGLRFNYQPELTQDQIDKGSNRPENVIGSYAVYHATKKNDSSQCGGKNYRCGKAFHIYRPKIIDDKGDWIWAVLNVDTKNSLLTVEIEQNWLDNAVYPIVVDPTFGQTDTGSSTPWNMTLNDIYGVGSIFPCDITTIQSMSIDCKAGYDFIEEEIDPFNIKCVMVLDTGVIIANGITPGRNVTNDSKHWETILFGTDPDATNYQGQHCIISFIVDEELGDWDSCIYFDNVYDFWDVSFTDNSNSYSSPTNPTDFDKDFGECYQWSIYATYTAAAGGGGDGGATQLVNGGLVS